VDVTILTQLDDGDGRSVVDSYVELVSRVAEEGFTRMWTAQLPWQADLLSVQALALREVQGIELGVAVLPIQVAHPMLTAQRALTLNAISGGRFKLGLGVAHPSFSEDLWGVPWEKPVRRMNEYLDGVLPLLAGEEAHAIGEMVTTGGSLRISNVPAPPVYIAAMGPQMLRVAARRTAGTITWMTGLKTLANHIAQPCGRQRPQPDAPRALSRYWPACLSVSPTTRTAPGLRQPKGLRSTAHCLRIARC
jgi:5,10-methylenetetrahydromethanopterin reductase